MGGESHPQICIQIRDFFGTATPSMGINPLTTKLKFTLNLLLIKQERIR